VTVQTKSQFYYVEDINETNFRLDFDDGLGEVTAEVDVGSYSPEELMVALNTALNLAGDQEYTVSFDRVTRLVTISASGNFDLLISTGGSAGTSIYGVLGFTGADLTGSNSYTADSEMVTVYRPQFYLQEYTAFEDNVESVSASINESASGKIEVISFGQRQFSEFNIKFITDLERSKSNILDNNQNAVQEARDFLNFIIKKGNLEFMLDRDNPNDFDTVLLESTKASRSGTGFLLKELTNLSLSGYFETGRLKFRKV